MTDDPQRTVHAQEAFEFGDVFGYKFGGLTFGNTPPRKLKLNEPEMSTGGGRKARQSIVLFPENGDSGRALVCGWLDVPRRVAELRSYNLLSQQHEARYGESIDLLREDYDRAIEELKSFFRIQKLSTTVIDAPPKPNAPSGAAREKTPAPIVAMSAMLLIGVLIGLGIGYLVFGLRVFGASG